jgi:hypothetical protein
MRFMWQVSVRARGTLLPTLPERDRARAGKRGVTPKTAWLLAGAFDTTPEFWLALQADYDLVRARPARKIRQLAAAG